MAVFMMFKFMLISWVLLISNILKIRSTITPEPILQNATFLVRELNLTEDFQSYCNFIKEQNDDSDLKNETILESIRSRIHGNTKIYVVKSKIDNSVVGTAALMIDHKTIHNCAKYGFIEDVYISSKLRGQNLGKLLIESIIKNARDLDILKVKLTCTQSLIRFYELNGFSVRKSLISGKDESSFDICMQITLKDD